MSAKNRYPELYARVEELFFRHDPIGINFGDNTDEYDPEVATVLPRLESCKNIQDVTNVLHSEFVRWFDADIAGPRDRYIPIAAELWQIWQDFKNPSDPL